MVRQGNLFIGSDFNIVISPAVDSTLASRDAQSYLQTFLKNMICLMHGDASTGFKRDFTFFSPFLPSGQVNPTKSYLILYRRCVLTDPSPVGISLNNGLQTLIQGNWRLKSATLSDP